MYLTGSIKPCIFCFLKSEYSLIHKVRFFLLLNCNQKRVQKEYDLLFYNFIIHKFIILRNYVIDSVFVFNYIIFLFKMCLVKL